MKRDYPLPSYYFGVSFKGFTGNIDVSFMEVEGIGMSTRDSMILSEGGLNQYQHKLPGMASFADIVLKRGVMKENSPLAQWCMDTITNDFSKPIEPKDLTIQLLNESQEILRTWNYYKAFPISMQYSTLMASKTAFLVQTLTFSYSYYSLTS
ncbi:phage tail protein [Aureibacter tunicatorum]|uniref:Phage tail-like protein n=1 Tax=Aureibacter tunicatorum TaxID=866807 RepID=A0AAE3XRX9_9BACT|nr:phage tail protein [Aureibacter tunicatorum]MDR6241653.1 phage tail-like protein [Aureibacter tunicatorum]BDD07361.1 hypothetical protein AUTU_48440 [Aureibacter tunicatorum]